MYNLVKLIFLLISLCACKDNYSVTLVKSNYINMSCNDLMLGLVEDSSFNKIFSDKKLSLKFYFERIDGAHIIIKFVRGAGVANGLIYANFELDLVNNTLKNIDLETSKSIIIKKDYIPFIAKKCTIDQNLYGDTGRLPDKELDGND